MHLFFLPLNSKHLQIADKISMTRVPTFRCSTVYHNVDRIMEVTPAIPNQESDISQNRFDIYYTYL